MFRQLLWSKASAFKWGLAAGGILGGAHAFFTQLLGAGSLASFLGATIGAMLGSALAFTACVALRNGIVRLRRTGDEPLERSTGPWPLSEMAISGFLGSSLLAALLYAAILLLVKVPAPDPPNAAVLVGAVFVGAVFVCGVGGAVYFVVVGLFRNSLLS